MPWFDIGVVLIVLVSVGIAFMRGFVKEILTIFAWLIAILATLFGAPALIPLVRSFISNRFLADGATYVSVFVLTALIFSFFTSQISK